MEPVGGEVAAARAFALGDLVFVMGKDEIDATGVEVEVVAKILLDHGRAFKVPAGPAFTPG